MRQRTIATAIASAKQELENYIAENNKRSAVKKNTARDTLFSQLIRKIDQIAVLDRETPIEKLVKIQERIQTAIELNHAMDGDAHAGLSTDALANALAHINEALPLEKRAEQERLANAMREAQESGAQRHARQIQDEATRKQMKAAIHHPIAVIEKAVHEKKLHELDIPQLVANIAQSIPVNPDDLTASQQAFYRALETEFQHLKLGVGPAMLNVIVRSPLAKRYEVLLEENKNSPTKKSGRELRKIIQVITEIVRICVVNQGSLKDLHNLFMLEDENSLLELFSLLHGKNMLINVENSARSEAVRSSRDDRYDGHVYGVLNSVISDGQLEMSTLGRALDQIGAFEKSAPRADGAAVAAVSTPQEDAIDFAEMERAINEATQRLYRCVKLSGVISNLRETISVSTHALVRDTQVNNAEQHHVALGAIAENLKPQFHLLIELTQLTERVRLDLARVFAHLDVLNKRLKVAQTQTNHVELVEKLKSLVADYRVWVSGFQNMRAELRDVLSALSSNSELDPRSGFQAAGRLGEISGRAREEAALKVKIQNDIAVLKDVITRQIATDQEAHAIQLAESVVAEPNQPQKLTIEFLVKLANKLNTSCDDGETAIDLIRRLQHDELFTQQAQYQLLHHHNMDALLALQVYLQELQIKVTPAELSRLWDKLHGNPRFDLLSPLQVQLKLNAQTVIKTIENLSSTWSRSLKMLSVMFKDRDSQEIFNQLIQSTEHNPQLITQIYKVYEAINKFCPDRLDELFRPEIMQQLIDAIDQCEAQFVDELVLRLEAVDYAPFKADEDLSYLIRRTKQYDARELSYVNVLSEWKKNARQHAFFDDYSRILLGQFSEKAAYSGAHPANAVAVNGDVDPGQPPIDRTFEAQWSFARANTTFHSVQFDELENRMRQTLAAKINLSPEHQFLLQLIQMTFQSNGSFFVDNAQNPSFVGWLPAGSVTTSQAQFMDYYLYFTIRELHEKVVELNRAIQEAKTLHAELVASGAANIRAFTVDLMSSPESDVRAVSANTAVGDGRITRFSALIDQIAVAKSQLTQLAVSRVRSAFDLPESAVVSAGMYSQRERHAAANSGPGATLQVALQ